MISKVKNGFAFILGLALLVSSFSNVAYAGGDGKKTVAASSNIFRGDMNIFDANGWEFGADYTIAIDKNGSAWEWGGNRFPSQKNLADYDVPGILKPVKKLDNIKVVSSGWNYSVAVKKDGSLWTWGRNEFGQLGNGTTKETNKPTKIMSEVITASAGGRHCVALKKDGTLWGWGLSDEGQLGRENKKGEDCIKSPVKILDNVAAISAGAFHTMVIRKDGSLWGSGGGPNLTNSGGVSIRNGEFGTGMKFVKVMDDVMAVSCGTISTAIIKKDGTLWTWGEGKPEKKLDNAIAVSSGNSHTLAIKKDGTLWAWGWNYFGQIGDGTNNAYVEKPKKVMDKVVYTCAGGNDSFAIRNDGSVWAWGYNNKGQLGDKTTKDKNKPFKIAFKVTKPLQSANYLIKDYKYSPVRKEIPEEKVNVNTLTDTSSIERLKAYPKMDDSRYVNLQPKKREVDFGTYAEEQPLKIERAYKIIKEFLIENKEKFKIEDTEFYTNMCLAYYTPRGITVLRGIIDKEDYEIEYGWMPDGTMVICTITKLK